MAREISNSRVVVAGDGNNDPSTCDGEYRVVDGDLTETPKRKNEASPDFNQTVTAMCTGAGTGWKSDESIV